MIFSYRSGQLSCDEVAISEIAAHVETPFYLYSARELRHNFQAFADAFADQRATICFAVKSCSNLSILRLLQKCGAGADIVSGGELQRALLAGISPEKIVFSGVGKTRAEIELALRSGIGQLNIESVEELQLVAAIATQLETKAPISIRINPDVEAGAHDKISTGREADKFGVLFAEAREIYRQAKDSPHLNLQGIACHIGSQITELEAFEKAFTRLRDLVCLLRDDGIHLRRIDLGGGLGIRYRDETPARIADYAEVISRQINPLGLRLFLEPGRRIAASAGALIARVSLIKTTSSRKFAVLDAGMNDLIRPALYGAYHDIVPVHEGHASETYDVVGPVCESSDIFGADRKLPELAEGDLVAILDSGAYGATMASNYNSRPLSAEVIVEGGHYQVIREQQTFEQMIASELREDPAPAPNEAR